MIERVTKQNQHQRGVEWEDIYLFLFFIHLNIFFPFKRFLSLINESKLRELEIVELSLVQKCLEVSVTHTFWGVHKWSIQMILKNFLKMTFNYGFECSFVSDTETWLTMITKDLNRGLLFVFDLKSKDKKALNHCCSLEVK